MNEGIPPPGTALAARAARINARGLQILKDFPIAQLREIWRRHPGMNFGAPAGQRQLAERIALAQIEAEERGTPLNLNDVLNSPVLRDEPTSPPKETTMTESTQPTPTVDGGTPAAAKPAAAPKPAKKANGSPKAAAKSAIGKTAAPPAKKSAKAASGARKGASKPAAKSPRADGPRPGTITALVVELTKQGKARDAIGAAVAKTFPDTTFASEVNDGSCAAVGWYQGQAVKKGWLAKGDVVKHTAAPKPVAAKKKAAKKK